MIIHKFNTKSFSLTVETMEERFPDLSFDDSGEISAQIESGDLEIFTVRARLRCNGMLVGEDYLSNCIYSNPRDFRDHFGIRRNCQGSYFSDMIRECVAQGRSSLNSIPTLRK